METKVVTINTLLTLSPAGTMDPTPFLYDSTMYFAASIVAIASVVSFFIRPVNSKYHEKIIAAPPKTEAANLHANLSTEKKIESSKE
jgi:hypothetical protein